MSDPVSRRDLFAALAAVGVACPVFGRAVAVQAEKPGPITPDSIKEAEWIAGLSLSEADRKAVARQVTQWQRSFARMREVKLGNGASFPLAFNPAPGLAPGTKSGKVEMTEKDPPKKPDSDDDLAFLPLTALAGLVRTRKVSSVELTKLYLKRLEDHGAALQCVVTRTDKLALEQAAQADKDIAAGKYRGPLHGIPWGAKDLIAYPGYLTTWGAEPFKEQTLEEKATVARRLDEAGAVLVAKLSLGALAWGDRWYGDRMTKNPWDPKRGSSGSSAGSASATAAGLVGFALGSETLGSIVSPSRECGNSSLRPTFGRVSRHGCMTLAWSMDKIGPMCRSIEDCALVFGAIHGRDGLDGSVVDQPFNWPCPRAVKDLKIGYIESATLEKDLKVLRDLGAKPVPIKLPTAIQAGDLTTIMYTETAAAFDELTNTGMANGPNNWKPFFQAGRFVSAVDYIRANRVRGKLMRDMEGIFNEVDLYVGGPDLVITNFTGHPQVVLPNGFTTGKGPERPTSLVLTGKLFGESELLAVAHAYQKATDYHLKHPKLAK